MKLTSPAFSYGASIPKQFTCDGQNISPALAWSGAPNEAKSFVLILHDPDAPRAGGFTHWVLYNIPPNVDWLSENVAHDPSVAGLGIQGRNDAGKTGYMGPCPPSGSHRYYARLYALSTSLMLGPNATPAEVHAAMQGNILAEAELMGTYERTGQSRRVESGTGHPTTPRNWLKSRCGPRS